MPLLTADAFSVDAVRSLGQADTDARVAAFDRFLLADAPAPEQEIWRYSRVADLRLERFQPGVATTSVTAPAAVSITASTGDESAFGDELDVFAELNRAFCQPLHIAVAAGVTVAEPVVVTHAVDAGGVACFPRLVIDAGADSEITVVEVFRGGSGGDALVLPVLRVRAAQAARVRYLAINELDESAWQISNLQSIGERDSTTLLSTVALGGDYARVRTHATLVGQGASTRQVALYFADGTQTHDFRVTQEHRAPKTFSDLLFKGAVNDQSHSVYTGLIKIGPDAKGTRAFQTNRNLTLSEGAWAESVPNLEIDTNDVQCSHASTVGPIDADQRFYLESRGIHPDVAERLVVLGFFDEVLEQLSLGDHAAGVRDQIAVKLHAPTVGGES